MADSSASTDLARQLSADELIDVLKDCVREVFVSVIFSFDPSRAAETEVEDPPPALPTSTLPFDTGIEVEFSGAVSGAVVLRAGQAAAEEITRSMLMMEPDEDLDPEDVVDALGECVNLVAGGLKTRVLDPLGTFGLGTPQPLQPASLERSDNTGRRQVYCLSQSRFSMEIWTDAGEGA